MPIGFMHSDGTLKHGNQHFIYYFDLTIGLRIIWRRTVVTQTQLGCQLGHHVTTKMRTMICDDGLRDSEPGNHMIEHKLSICLTVISQCRHHFSPFCKVINDDNNITMPPDQVRVTGHKINAPLCKGANGNDRVQKSRRRTHLALVDLTRMTGTDGKNAILENGWPKITSMKNLLSGGITRHVTATGTRVTVVQNFLSFLKV